MSYREEKIVYYQYPGDHNTAMTLRLAFERAVRLSVNKVITASSRGHTAQEAAKAMEEAKYQGDLIVVGLHQGFHMIGHQEMPAEIITELRSRGVPVYFGTHALSSASRSFRNRWGGADILEVLAEGYRRFSRGIKVGIEISLMACDAGLVSPQRDVIAVGGTGKGADSAIVLHPSSTNNFFELKIKEIICMPCLREIDFLTDVTSLLAGGLDEDGTAEQLDVPVAAVCRVSKDFKRVKELNSRGYSLHEIDRELKLGESMVEMYLKCIR